MTIARLERTTTRLCSLAGTAALLLVGAPCLAAAQDVTVTISGGPQIDGDGVVTSSPSGINCTVTYPATTGTCSATFAKGTVVTLTATPAPLNTFEAWAPSVLAPGCTTSPTCQVTANVNTAMTPLFTPARFPLTIVGAGIGYGRISGSATHAYFGAAGLFCEIQAGVASGTCTDQYAVNRPIEIRL